MKKKFFHEIKLINTKASYVLKAIQEKSFTVSEELQILTQLKSPFIIEFKEWFREGFVYCMILEYCEVNKSIN